MRDRLIDLLCGHYMNTIAEAEDVADYLLENGVIVPPCKVGDELKGEIVHQVEYIESLGFEGKIERIKMVHTYDKDSIGKYVFASHPFTWEEWEEVEAKLKGGEG